MVNWHSFRFNFAEASGALGDLGTFLPWLIALAVNNGYATHSYLATVTP